MVWYGVFIYIYLNITLLQYVCIIVCTYFIWQNPFRLQIIVKSIKKQAFLDSTKDSTGKY